MVTYINHISMSSEFSPLSHDTSHMKIGRIYQMLAKNNFYITFAVYFLLKNE